MKKLLAQYTPLFLGNYLGFVVIGLIEVSFKSEVDFEYIIVVGLPICLGLSLLLMIVFYLTGLTSLLAQNFLKLFGAAFLAIFLTITVSTFASRLSIYEMWSEIFDVLIYILLITLMLKWLNKKYFLGNNI